MKNSRILIGIFIIIIGFLLLFDQWGMPIRLGIFWPIILLIPGVFFWTEFLATRQRIGLVMPATILTLYSLYFFINELCDYRLANELSFIFTFAVAAGLFLMHHFSVQKRRGLLIASWILGGISFITLISTIGQGKYWPVLFIILGCWILLQRRNNTTHPNDT